MKNFFEKLKNKKESADGLPSIAEMVDRKKPVIIVLVVVCLIAAFSLYRHSKGDKPAVPLADESYNVASDTNDAPAVDHTHPASQEPQQQAAATPSPAEVAYIQEKQKELMLRLSAPLMLVANNAGDKTEASDSKPPAAMDVNSEFMQRASSQSDQTMVARSMGELNATVLQGSYIHAVLETATDSDLPGTLRASVSSPVYSADGTRILIPMGSHLNGVYKTGIASGQSRIFIVWTRLITTDGVSVDLGSPGVDSLGVAGMAADEINHHFWERFSLAAVLSTIDAGVANVGVNGRDAANSSSDYRSGLANSFGESANQSLQNDGNIATTLQTYQGKPIMVYVAHDLNFAAALNDIKAKINVF